MRDQVANCLVACEPREGGVSARFKFASDLPVFEGHFPGRPLVPGVFLIEAARLVSEQTIGAPLRVSRVVKAKFMGEVGPGADVELDAEFVEVEGEVTLRARLRTVTEGSAADAASLRLVLARESA